MSDREYVYLMLYRSGEIVPIEGHRLFLVDAATAQRWVDDRSQANAISLPGIDLADLLRRRCSYRWDGEPLVKPFNRFDPLRPEIQNDERLRGATGHFLALWPAGLENTNSHRLVVRGPTGEWRRAEHLAVGRFARADVEFAGRAPVSVRDPEQASCAALASLLVQPNFTWDGQDVARAAIRPTRLDAYPDGTPIPPVPDAYRLYWDFVAEIRNRYRPGQRRKHQIMIAACVAAAAYFLVSQIGSSEPLSSTLLAPALLLVMAWIFSWNLKPAQFGDELLEEVETVRQIFDQPASAHGPSTSPFNRPEQTVREASTDGEPSEYGEHSQDDSISSAGVPSGRTATSPSHAALPAPLRSSGELPEAPTRTTTPSGLLVFISYSSRDEERAHEFVAELEAAGLRCWLAARDITAGARGYHSRILEAINQSWLVLVLCSRHSVESSHVANELEHATGLKRPILPVLLEGFDPTELGDLSYFLKRFQMVRLPAPPGTVSRLAAGIADDLGIEM
jgi:hypothetical protein